MRRIPQKMKTFQKMEDFQILLFRYLTRADIMFTKRVTQGAWSRCHASGRKSVNQNHFGNLNQNDFRHKII